MGKVKVKVNQLIGDGEVFDEESVRKIVSKAEDQQHQSCR